MPNRELTAARKTKSVAVSKLSSLLLCKIAPLAVMGSAMAPMLIPNIGTIQYLLT